MPTFGPVTIPKPVPVEFDTNIQINIGGSEISLEELGKALVEIQAAPGVDFSNQKIIGADLSGKDMSGADFKLSKLTNVNMQNANLTEADFSYTKFDNVNLQGADLTGANLLQARNLSEANLTGIKYDSSTLWPRGFTPPESF